MLPSFQRSGYQQWVQPMVLASSWRSSASIGIGGIGGIGHLTFLCWRLSLTSWKRSSTISIPVDSTHFFHVWGVPILLTAPIQRQMFQETQLHHQSVPSMCEQCVRHPMLRVLATVKRSAKWPSDLDFKIEGRGFYECFMTFSSEILSDIGKICQEVGQMLPNAGWR